MKANVLNANTVKRRLKQMIKDESVKHCEKCLEQINRDFVTTSKYNAMFHVMHLLVILHDEYGFGKKRLERLLGAYADADKSFREDLSDGVAWTKIRKRLEAVGLEFSKEEIEIGNAKERLFEKGITYSDRRRKNK